jgi:hypothetical protein
MQLNFSLDRERHLKIRRTYIDRVSDINKTKLDSLELLLIKITDDSDNFDGESFKEFSKHMGRLGGQISGLVRAYKSDLMFLCMQGLINNNSPFFDNYGATNYELFLKHFLKSSLTRSKVLGLLGSDVTWQDKRLEQPEIHRSNYNEDFIKGLDELKLGQFCSTFDAYYQSFREEVMDIGTKFRLDFQGLKKDYGKILKEVK